MQRLSAKMLCRIEEVVAPLRAIDGTGEVFGVDIQQGKVTHEPHCRTFWSEVRLIHQPDGQWHLTYSHIAGDPTVTVYRGKLPLDRAWWLTLIQHANLGWAGRILSKTSVTRPREAQSVSKTAGPAEINA